MLFTSKDYVTTTYLQFAAILFGASFTLIALFVPKFTVISKHIHKKWRKLMNAEQVNSNTNPNIQLNMVTERTQDFTYEAHEGVLPVKKVTRFDLLSIWTLKRIVLVPFQKCFIISDVSLRLSYNISYLFMYRNRVKMLIFIIMIIVKL